MGEDRCCQPHDNDRSCHVHDRHQTAPVAAIHQHTHPGACQQPRQALHGGNGCYSRGCAGELCSEQWEGRQPDAITEVSQKPRQPVTGERSTEPSSERGHSSIMPNP
jgi:hypothetical protein